MTADAGADCQDEPGRQRALERLQVLDTEREESFERITGLVKSVLDVPIAAVSLIDGERQWFKSIQGLDVAETPRDVAFCDHTIRRTECLHVTDARADPRFRDNPLVTGEPHIRAYLGAPLLTADRFAVGALCAIDRRPREFSDDQARVLEEFAGLVMNELELRIIAATDPLTGLATRRAFISALEDARDSASDVALISVDLDHFKSINDTYGHPVGDEVLRSVAAALLSTCPDCAVTGRLGGEELAVLVTGEEARRAAGLAEAIRTAIEAARIDGLEDLDFTASVGLAGCDPAAGPEDWMDLADRALYAAKNAGRNRVEASAA